MFFKELSNAFNHCSPLTYAQCIDINTYLPSNILNKVDMASMYHGLEVRTPLIDKKMINLFSILPDHYKIRKNGGKNSSTKFLLKEKLKTEFKSDFINRPKKGFSMPYRNWIKGDSKLAGLLKDIIFSKTSQLNKIFNKSELENQEAKLESETQDAKLELENQILDNM